MKCQYCAEEIGENQKSCPICKESLVNLCKFCKEEIATGAIKCKHCGSMQNTEILTASNSNTNASGISDVLVWIVAVTPILSTIMAIMLFGDERENIDGVFALIINIVFCYMDAGNLKKQGFDTSNIMAWLVPVYLYKRAKLLNQNMAYFAVWCVLFSISFFA